MTISELVKNHQHPSISRQQLCLSLQPFFSSIQAAENPSPHYVNTARRRILTSFLKKYRTF